jgi:predicted aspartyl protease
MGDIIRKATVHGIRGALDDPEIAGSETCDALLDTGATATVISARLARRIGAVAVKRQALFLSPSAGDRRLPLAAVTLSLGGGCKTQLIFAAVSDAIADDAGHEVVVGHDYLQRAHVRLDCERRTATCVRRPGRAARRA